MPTLKFTEEQLKLWFSGSYFHKDYDETVALADRIAVHANGEYPGAIIDERRPNESDKIKDYRKLIWKAITKPYFSKVLTSLNKIRRSTEWSVLFDERFFPARIAESERLDNYLTYNFPKFESLTNWAFALLLREWGIDANAWIVVAPESDPVNPSDYVKPYPFIFKSEQVIEPAEGDYLVVISTDKSIYYVDETPKFGDKYYIVTTQEIQTWEQISDDRKFKLAKTYIHGIGELPAFKVKALVQSSNDGTFINESRLAGMIEWFDEAVREYSDLQAEVIQHIYSERWEIGGAECQYCSGKGERVIPGFRSKTETCRECNGSGYKPRGPYSELIIAPPMAGENSIPNPPMGYIDKDVTIVETQDKRFDKHIWRGLAAINMEFLFEKPLNESGISKAYDADETNNFVHSCAEDIIAIMDKVAYFINEMRYHLVVPNKYDRMLMLPKIQVPERFDIFSSQVIEQELTNAKDKKINPVIINAMEIEYASKKFATNEDVAARLGLTLSLDPLPNISEEDKMMRLQNGGITKQIYILSCNIHEFIARAIEEHGDKFYSMASKDQKDILKNYALEQSEDSTSKQEVISEVIEP